MGRRERKEEAATIKGENKTRANESGFLTKHSEETKRDKG